MGEYEFLFGECLLLYYLLKEEKDSNLDVKNIEIGKRNDEEYLLRNSI